MKKKNSIFLIIFFITGSIFLISDFSLASKGWDPFNDILQMTNSKIVEYGITATFITDKDGEKVCNDILKKMNFIDAKNKSVLKNEKKYCIEFGKNNTNGYIETMKYENHNVITIRLVEKSNNNLLSDMKCNLEKCIDDRSVTVKYYQYLKSEVYADVDTTNDKILKVLKNHGASNITTVALKNGYSSTLYTGLYDAMQSNGKLMDFNYAVCKYNSGNYIIMGTPEILLTY